MRILLLGEYSNLHNTLEKALKTLGHEVYVISDGDGWKGYESDIQLKRFSNGFLGSVDYGLKLLKLLPFMRGFDVVQIINPVFIKMKTQRNRMLFDYLKKYNKSVFLGAFGSDYYIASGSDNNSILKYSEYFYDGKRADNEMINLQKHCWMETSRKELTQYIVENCNGVIACLYEYFKVYERICKDKLSYIPLPIDNSSLPVVKPADDFDKIRMFIGIQKKREYLKGTDIVLPVLEKLSIDYKDEIDLTVVRSIPYDLYEKKLSASNMLFDQLFSYTPAMNALLAMSKGIVVAGGGEEEMYELLGEEKLRPIINIVPEKETLYAQFENIIKKRDSLPLLSSQSIEFVDKYHNYIKVAKRYVDFWTERM